MSSSLGRNNLHYVSKIYSKDDSDAPNLSRENINKAKSIQDDVSLSTE